MLERRTESPRRGTPRPSVKGIKMSENISPASVAAATVAVPAEAIDAVRGSLAPKNSVGEASVEFYRAALAGAGVDPETLSFAEAVEVTRRLYALSAGFRRDRADVAKVEREEAAKIAKAKRDAEREERAKAEIKKIEAKLAKLRG